MTEDPVKLYVIVMCILLCVLGYVAVSSYADADALEQALLRAPQEATQFKELATDVQALIDQLDKSELERGKRTLIDNVARRMGIVHSDFDQSDGRIGRGIKGKEERYKYSFGSGRTSPPLTRDRIAQFCQAVERDSRGILKTIEVRINRVTGQGVDDPGTEGRVTGDTYKGYVVFGLRVVE